MLVPAGVSYSHCFCRVNVTSFSEEDDELSTGQFLILITSKMDRIMSKLVMSYRTPTQDVTVILQLYLGQLSRSTNFWTPKQKRKQVILHFQLCIVQIAWI